MTSEVVATLGNGCHLFRKVNEAGGYTYSSDEIGGGVVVWDSALVSIETVLTALADYMKTQKIEQWKKRNDS